MTDKMSTVETFLTDFHDARPGLTSKSFGDLPVTFRERQLRSSYEILAAVVPDSNADIAVLDLACGDGYLLSLLASRCLPGLVLSGVDMSASELVAARVRLGDRFVLQQAKAQALPFPADHFDYVLCHLALMLMDDAEQVLREIRRVLKPSGTLAAIVGAAPPPSQALSVYVDALRRHPRQEHLSEVRFGDRRFRNHAGIVEILSSGFHQIAVEDINITQRIEPNALWKWFLDMYDLYLLNETDRQTVKREFLSSVSTHCGLDGKLEHLTTLRFFSATAA